VLSFGGVDRHRSDRGRVGNHPIRTTAAPRGTSPQVGGEGVKERCDSGSIFTWGIGGVLKEGSRETVTRLTYLWVLKTQSIGKICEFSWDGTS